MLRPALAFALLFAGSTAVQPKVAELDSSQSHRLDFGQTSKMATIRDGVQLHYLDWQGNGPTVLLLAGLGDTAYIYADTAPLLKQSYRVLALTRRGYGRSDVTREGYAIEDRVEDIREFCDQLRLSKVILVGHSTAGDELTAFARKYPERVQGLLYLDAAYDRGDPETPKPHMDAWNTITAQLYGGVSEDQSYASRDARRRALQNLFRMDYGVGWNDALEANLRETTVENADGSLSPRAPFWVADAIRKGVRSTPFEIPSAAIPALLVFARGRLEDQAVSIGDKQALSTIERDEDEYQTYFENYISRLKSKLPGIRTKILPRDRHYFFLRDPNIISRLLSELAAK
ncbi:MAG TPA: alpha/beta hydrolase [Candidatus Sulfotelmatobacter sp.]|nr:alpha/beta hydrolase [Candidatus Sulfotelmatobacter sp.]